MCIFQYSFLGVYTLMGFILSIYAAERVDSARSNFYFSAGLFPLLITMVYMTGWMGNCAINILSGGAAVLLVFSVVGLYWEDRETESRMGRFRDWLGM